MPAQSVDLVQAVPALDVRHLPESFLLNFADKLTAAASNGILDSSVINIANQCRLPFQKDPQSTLDFLHKIDLARNLNSKIVFPQVYTMLLNNERI